MAITGTGFIVSYHSIRWATYRFFRWSPHSVLERLLVALSSLIIAGMVLLNALNFYVYYGFDYQPDIYRKGNPDTNWVALTFDDGPSSEFTPAILDILAEYGVQATFFLVGKHVEKYPEIARRIVEEGHEIGNHTHRHLNLPTLPHKTLYEEIIRATRVITTVTGRYPGYFRPPRGMYDARSRRLAHLLGQKVVLWSVSSRDWRYGTTGRAIVKQVVSRTRGGDILLFHDSGAFIRSEGGNRRATVEALPLVIEGLLQKGLEIVPLHLLLEEERGEELPWIEVPE